MWGVTGRPVTKQVPGVSIQVLDTIGSDCDVL